MDTSTGGRQNQKERTRRAIVAAAAKLVAAGTLPTMPEVADEALVSTATAYRYFPDQLSLLSAALQDGYAGIGERFQPDIGTEGDLERRVDVATEGLLRRIVEREPLVRTVMALSLLRSVDGATPAGAAAARPGFRRAWIDEALRPAEDELDPEKLRLLKLALGAVMSSEALIALEDVMGAESSEAIEVCRWMARTLTGAMVRETRPKPPVRPRKDGDSPR
ncbi:MAG: TetR/AcrR family transcriptional regulator [Dehalococcoidia bacterium]|nr:MAG: TetR/AcrR family transcriptional regulator [Dehalococcoidia bacterium]